MKLRCINLGKRIGTKLIVSQVNCDFSLGEVHFLLGRNGAGKTTLLRLIAHLDRPSVGKIEVRDQDNHQLIASRCLPKNFAWVPSSSPRPFDFSVRDTVVMGRYAHHLGFPQAADRSICEEALEQMQISELADQSIVTLSSGEFHRVLIARALALRPSVIILDEPSAHLDWPSTHDFFSRLKTLAQKGLCVIASVHDPHLAIKYATHVLGIRKGRIALHSPVAATDFPNIERHIYSADQSPHGQL